MVNRIPDVSSCRPLLDTNRCIFFGVAPFRTPCTGVSPATVGISDARNAMVSTTATAESSRSLKLETERVRLLHECGLFRSCQESEVEKLAVVASVRNFPAGTVVIRQVCCKLECDRNVSSAYATIKCVETGGVGSRS